MLNNSILKKNDNDVVSSREVNKKLRVSVIYIYKIAYKSLLDYFFKFFIKKKKKSFDRKNYQLSSNQESVLSNNLHFSLSSYTSLPILLDPKKKRLQFWECNFCTCG